MGKPGGNSNEINMAIFGYLLVPFLFTAKYLWFPVAVAVWYFFGLGPAIFWGAILFYFGLDSKRSRQTQHKAGSSSHFQ